MSKINWNGSQGKWRARPAQPAGERFGQAVGKVQGSARAGYLTLAVALVTVAAGSAGATILAMSLMSADVPEFANGVAEVAVAEAQASVASAPGNSDSSATGSASTATIAPQPEAGAQPVVVAGTATAQPSSSAPEPEADVAALTSSDPRWAQFEKPAPSLDELRNEVSGGEASAFGSAGQSAGAVAAVNQAVQDSVDEPGQDAQQTAAITPPPRVAEPKAEAAGRQIVLNTAANVRSRANKSGKVLGAIPAGVKVVSYGCRSSWCEVSHKGLRGWVYSGFVGGNAKNKEKGDEQAKTTNASAQRQKLKVNPAAKPKSDGALPGVKTNEPLPAATIEHQFGR